MKSRKSRPSDSSSKGTRRSPFSVAVLLCAVAIVLLQVFGVVSRNTGGGLLIGLLAVFGLVQWALQRNTGD